jgi:tetratricopeptide (TPR) repeat protein
MSQVQIKRGYFENAILNLERLYSENKTSNEIIFALLDAYNSAYKLNQSKRLLSTIANTPLRNDYRYDEKSADYYIAKGSLLAAVNWLQQAINKNPLEDANIYKLAKIFLQNNKFNEAKLLLIKCIELDPANVDYRKSYGQVIYEVDGVREAIGYLYTVLEKFPDNTKILGAIALNYYKSGQIKKYENINSKINSLPNKDKDYYIALFELARIEDKLDRVIEMLKKIIQISPGDLEYRIQLGRYLIAKADYKGALKQFDRVEERLKSYPRLQYYKSQLYMMTDNTKEALALANKEVKDNPDLIDGYILKGQILLKKEKFIESEKTFQQAQRLDGQNIEVLKGLAYIAFIKNQYDMALDLYKKAIKIDGSEAELHRLIGDVYRKIGQSQLARESYKLYLELDPNSSYKNKINTYLKRLR